ncbi:Bromodomain-containing protein [Gymnopilus junonius]|uniref:Bromodomain-containing protein n=1 Tax=Gymnopilus junonius TaxID=109634 RepID=A0A9P5NUY0_GYMJU|nr:Bromodomain-containing protein [Gymnopilus junonius]
MSKRELESLNWSADNEGSRHKRRRETGGYSSDVDVTMSDPIEPGAENGGGASRQEVREQGLKLWQTVKDAVNKEGVIISTPFLRKPLKRQYPDYYAIIKQPIALDDIKKQLDSNGYATLEAVKTDFELLFGNAKAYNQTESAIYQDAKELLKLVHKTYNKMVPSEEDGDNGKPKQPNLTRLIRTRLEKLVAKTDFDGRVLSDEFMQLPSKKLWPIYYKTITKPRCFEEIFKSIKRKEYETTADFAADVELVFSNATTFNQDHTPIWNDAVALREYFRQLMSDLPPPHNLPEYTKPSNKIKIKPPQPIQPTPSSSALPSSKTEPPKSTPQASTSATPTLPKTTQAPSLPTPTPAPLPTTKPAPSPASKPKPKDPPPQVPVQSKAPTPLPPPQQAVSFINATPSHYPRTAAYAVHAPAPIPAPATDITRPSSTLNVNIPSASQSPAPASLPPSHQLKSINIGVQPTGRTVKCWALRLMPGETTVLVNDISFMGDEEDEESSDEEEHDGEKQEDEDAMDVDVDVETTENPSPTKSGRKKGRGRGRGRTAKVTRAAQAAQAMKAAKAAKKKAVTKIGEIHLKLNKIAVKELPEKPGEWNVYLPVGANTIEVGESGGMSWKIYAERLADA